jgi:hypothetical protein
MRPVGSLLLRRGVLECLKIGHAAPQKVNGALIVTNCAHGVHRPYTAAAQQKYADHIRSSTQRGTT